MLSWQTLKKISDAPVITRMYFWVVFVPVVAKILATVQSPLNITVFGASIPIQLQLPFSWVLFFLSSLCFVVALIIYVIWSPRIIKEHPSYSHFLSEGKSRYQLKEYALQVGFDQNDMNKAQKIAGGAKATNEEEMQQMFWILMINAENKNKVMRCFSALFYSFGFIFMGVVFIQNAIFVIKQLLNAA